MHRLTLFLIVLFFPLSLQAATVILVPGLLGEAGIKKVTTDLLAEELKLQGMNVVTAFNNEEDIRTAYAQAEGSVCLVGHSYGALAIMETLERNPDMDVEGVILVSAAISRSRDLSTAKNYRRLQNLYSSGSPDLLLLAATLLPGGMGSLGATAYSGPNDGRITSIGRPTGHFGYFGEHMPYLVRTILETVE